MLEYLRQAAEYLQDNIITPLKQTASRAYHFIRDSFRDTVNENVEIVRRGVNLIPEEVLNNRFLQGLAATTHLGLPIINAIAAAPIAQKVCELTSRFISILNQRLICSAFLPAAIAVGQFASQGQIEREISQALRRRMANQFMGNGQEVVAHKSNPRRQRGYLSNTESLTALQRQFAASINNMTLEQIGSMANISASLALSFSTIGMARTLAFGLITAALGYGVSRVNSTMSDDIQRFEEQRKELFNIINHFNQYKLQIAQTGTQDIEGNRILEKLEQFNRLTKSINYKATLSKAFSAFCFITYPALIRYSGILIPPTANQLQSDMFAAQAVIFIKSMRDLISSQDAQHRHNLEHSINNLERFIEEIRQIIDYYEHPDFQRTYSSHHNVGCNDDTSVRISNMKLVIPPRENEPHSDFREYVSSVLQNSDDTMVKLNKANLTLKKGHTYRLVAPNGSGKSCLMDALIGCFATVSGQSHFTMAKEDICYVPQNIFIPYCDTLLNVILYGTGYNIHNMDATTLELQQQKIKICLQRLGEQQLIEQLTKEAIWSEQLSGGEKQIIGWLRVLLRPTPPSLLLLDEPIAALSSKYAQTVQEMVSEMLPSNATTVYVQHEKGKEPSMFMEEQPLANTTHIIYFNKDGSKQFEVCELMRRNLEQTSLSSSLGTMER